MAAAVSGALITVVVYCQFQESPITFCIPSLITQGFFKNHPGRSLEFSPEDLFPHVVFYFLKTKHVLH